MLVSLECRRTRERASWEGSLDASLLDGPAVAEERGDAGRAKGVVTDVDGKTAREGDVCPLKVKRPLVPAWTEQRHHLIGRPLVAVTVETGYGKNRGEEAGVNHPPHAEIWRITFSQAQQGSAELARQNAGRRPEALRGWDDVGARLR